jgi:hypothetical protein
LWLFKIIRYILVKILKKPGTATEGLVQQHLQEIGGSVVK